MNAMTNKIPPAFHIMAKPVGPLCNLDCKYCFYLEKENLYPNTSQWAMPEQVMESFIRQTIRAHSTPTVNFSWQGGEPTLLGVDYFRKIVELEKKYANGKKIDNAFQTNGVLLNDEWCEFFAQHHFLIGLSIDGPRHLHDKFRVDKGQKPTFDKVMRGLRLLEKHGVEFNTLTVLQRHNADYPLEVYSFLKETGSGFIQFIPIVERIATTRPADGLSLVLPTYDEEAKVSEWAVDPEQFGRFLCTVFDEWVRKDVGKYFVQLFDVALESWAGYPQNLCLFSETCGTALALEHNGDLYSCDHFVYPENKLGNIMEDLMKSMVSSPQQVKFGLDKQNTLPRYCRQCEVRFACNGECPKNRFLRTPDGEPGLNYLCAGYKMFFQHIDPYMRFMANELNARRPPANVMQWVAGQNSSSAGNSISRNAPCPCGSGKRYKRCCGK